MNTLSVLLYNQVNARACRKRDCIIVAPMAIPTISGARARRKVLEDLIDSTHPIDVKLYRAVMELSKSKGDMESLSFSAIIREPEITEDKLIKELYGTNASTCITA